jgi:hypothetical protein
MSPIDPPRSDVLQEDDINRRYSVSSERLREVEARELRFACIHEAGHATVASVLGGHVQPYVWRNPRGKIDEKAWRGTCRLLCALGSIPPRPETSWIRPAPAHADVLLGLAGLVAETIADGMADADLIYVEIDVMIMLNSVSASDLALMGERWPDHLDQVVDLLLAHWQEVERHARNLEEVALLQGDEGVSLS